MKPELGRPWYVTNIFFAWRPVFEVVTVKYYFRLGDYMKLACLRYTGRSACLI